MTIRTGIARNKPARPYGASPETITLFDADALRRRVMGLPSRARSQHDAEILPPHLCDPPAADDIDEGEKRRRDWHLKMLRHPMGEKRKLLNPSRDLNASLKLLEEEAPQFGRFSNSSPTPMCSPWPRVRRYVCRRSC